MKSLIPAVSLISLLALAGVSACETSTGSGTKAPGMEVSPDQLKAGGVYVAYMNGCDKGCDQIAKGDLIMAVDDKPVTGTKLVRNHQGVEHTVTVLADGYSWEGRPYKSLSAIARVKKRE